MRKATIAHEIGHALKLQHLVEAVFNVTNNSFYLDEYKGWETYPSIMMPDAPGLGNEDAGNTYLGTVVDCYGAQYITIYDTACLIQRWERM